MQKAANWLRLLAAFLMQHVPFLTLYPTPNPCRYTAHVEGQLRMCALDALQAVMQSAPGLRGGVLVSVARFLSSIPDDAVQVGGWLACLLARRVIFQRCRRFDM